MKTRAPTPVIRNFQDELVQALRSDGRRQAAQRMLRQKRDCPGGIFSGHGDSQSGSGE